MRQEECHKEGASLYLTLENVTRKKVMPEKRNKGEGKTCMKRNAKEKADGVSLRNTVTNV